MKCTFLLSFGIYYSTGMAFSFFPLPFFLFSGRRGGWGRGVKTQKLKAHNSFENNHLFFFFYGLCPKNVACVSPFLCCPDNVLGFGEVD